MGKTKLGFLCLISLSLAACAVYRTPSQITLKDLSPGHYQLVASSAENGQALLDAINKAFNICKHQGKELVVTNLISDYQSVVIYDDYKYHSTIDFICSNDTLRNVDANVTPFSIWYDYTDP
jgi:hypothetical protein